MREINDIIDFAGSMFERLPQQSYAMMALFVVWCGSGLIGVLVFRKRSARLQKQLDQLKRDVRRLELEESRRIISELHNLTSAE